LPNSRVKDDKWFLTISDEVLFNLGNEVKNKMRLDQNRISIGGGLQMKKMTFQLAYMNQLIENSQIFEFKMTHNLQLLIFHNF
jgi:hypothetical protein